MINAQALPTRCAKRATPVRLLLEIARRYHEVESITAAQYRWSVAGDANQKS